MEKIRREIDHEDVCTREDIQVRFEFYADANHLITSHWHNSMEIIYLYSGCMDVTINERNITLAEGDFCIINSADVHSTYCRGSSRVILLQIPYSFLKKAIPEYDTIRFEGNFLSINCIQEKDKKINEQIKHILLTMKDINEKKPESYFLLFSSLLYEFLFLLMNHYKLQVDTQVKIRTEKNLERLDEVAKYVKTHYSSNITLEDAAGVLNLHPEYFCRFFKKYMGVTFLEYVNKIRLTHVFDALIHSDLSITDILDKNGCTNYKLFMKNFKKTYGCTPMQMRKYQRNFFSSKD